MSHLEHPPIKLIEVWFNRSERSWVVQAKDDEGCQVDAAHYFGARDVAFYDARLQAIVQKADLVHSTMGMREIKRWPAGSILRA